MIHNELPMSGDIQAVTDSLASRYSRESCPEESQMKSAEAPSGGPIPPPSVALGGQGER